MESLYRTKDLGEASALANYDKIKLVRLDYDKEGFYWFVFNNANLAKAVSQTYWFGNLMQDVKKYNESLQNLKDMIHSQNAEIVKGRTVSVKERA